MQDTFDTSLSLTADQYHPGPVPKIGVVLHHTVSSNVKSVHAHWQGNVDRVGTALAVDQQGQIYQFFPLTGWAIHLFRSRPDKRYLRLEQQTIGIELISEGGLIEKRGQLWATYGTKPLGSVGDMVKAGRAVDLGKMWRGYRYFDAYDEPQVAATIALARWLCATFKITPTLSPECANPKGDASRYLDSGGVFTHACVRPDKSDLHPLFPYDRLASALAT